MAPVVSACFLSSKGGGAVGADLLRVQQGLSFQALEASRFLCVGDAPVAANSTPSQRRRGQGKLTGSSPGVYVVKRITPY